MTTKNINELKSALINLGVKNGASVRLNGDKAIVTVNGEYFGLWDITKETFVD